MSTAELLNLARDKSEKGRESLARAITDIFVESGDELTERERTLSLEILRHLVHDFEIAVRKTVSEQLAGWKELPEDLANFLANDEIEIASEATSKSSLSTRRIFALLSSRI